LIAKFIIFTKKHNDLFIGMSQKPMSFENIIYKRKRNLRYQTQ